jgi:hypothetical protein
MFREVCAEGAESGCFANHCPHCGSVQDDLYLHSEPGDAFFHIPHHRNLHLRCGRLKYWVPVFQSSASE